MSLGKTLLKVAIGVAIAKGVQAMTKGASASPAPAPKPTTKTAGRGTRYEGGLEDMMGDVLGTNRSGTTARDDGGDLLEQITGKRRTSTRSNAPKGGLDDVLEQMTGARTGRGGANAGTGEGGFGDLLGSILGGASSTARRTPEQDQEISAALMLRAIITAVKADGDLDADEKQKLMEAMGDASAAEVKAVNAELGRAVDVDSLVRIVPRGMEAQVYMVSLTAINLDQQAEAQYLHALAQGLELSEDEVNALHDRAGAPRLYR
jgi:Protein of unknown function (DUF533)